jgi:hypothetical protein
VYALDVSAQLAGVEEALGAAGLGARVGEGVVVFGAEVALQLAVLDEARVAAGLAAGVGLVPAVLELVASQMLGGEECGIAAGVVASVRLGARVRQLVALQVVAAREPLVAPAETTYKRPLQKSLINLRKFNFAEIKNGGGRGVVPRRCGCVGGPPACLRG